MTIFLEFDYNMGYNGNTNLIYFNEIYYFV